MNLRWLKDFVALAELGSFSRAADSRAITQPAMSRHIKALEDQLGFRLIDRSVFPATLTVEGKQFHSLALSLVTEYEHGVAEIHKQSESDSGVIRFAMQHVLASDFFSLWWQKHGQGKVVKRVAVEANNLHDCVQKLENGEVHLMMCYQSGDEVLDLDPAHYVCKQIGQDTMVPVSAIKNGKPAYALSSSKIVPLACSGASDFMGKVVDHLIAENDAAAQFERVYEDSFSEGVRSQVIAGTALGWLPMVLVQRDIDEARLGIVGGSEWRQTLNISLYVRRDQLNGGILELWEAVKAV